MAWKRSQRSGKCSDAPPSSEPTTEDTAHEPASQRARAAAGARKTAALSALDRKGGRDALLFSVSFFDVLLFISARRVFLRGDSIETRRDSTRLAVAGTSHLKEPAHVGDIEEEDAAQHHRRHARRVRLRVRERERRAWPVARCGAANGRGGAAAEAAARQIDSAPPRAALVFRRLSSFALGVQERGCSLSSSSSSSSPSSNAARDQSRAARRQSCARDRLLTPRAAEHGMPAVDHAVLAQQLQVVDEVPSRLHEDNTHRWSQNAHLLSQNHVATLHSL